MAFDLKSISRGTIERAPRILLCGVEKIGKSTFAAGFPDPVFIPVNGEEGIDSLEVARFPIVTEYQQIIEAIGSLWQGGHDFKTLVIDSISTLEAVVFAEVCRREGVPSIEKIGYGKGYVLALDLWREILDGIDALRDQCGMGCVLIGHVIVRSHTDPMSDSYDVYDVDMHKKAAAVIMRWCDSILFASSKVAVKKEQAGGFSKNEKRAIGSGARVLYTQKRPAHPGGGRGIYGRLPYELELDFDVFNAAVEAARKGL